MAYLTGGSVNNTKTKGSKGSHNRGKVLLKCGFVVTGRPKKVWAFNLPDVLIDVDDEDNHWMQI